MKRLTTTEFLGQNRLQNKILFFTRSDDSDNERAYDNGGIMSDNMTRFSFSFTEAAGDDSSLPPDLNEVLSSPSDLLDEFVAVDMFSFGGCSSASLLKLSVSDRSSD